MTPPRLRSLPVVLGGLLLVVVAASEFFDAGPTGLVAVGGFALVFAVVLGRYAVRRRRRSGPAWSEDARASRAEATEAAAALAELRERRERGDITDAEFAARVEERLDAEAYAEAREAVEEGVDPAEFDDDGAPEES